MIQLSLHTDRLPGGGRLFSWRRMVKKLAHPKSSLERTLVAINHQFGAGSILRLGEAQFMNVTTFSSGVLELDWALGGGFPRGRIVEIYGSESSGKTTLALQAIAEVQKAGGTAAFIDAVFRPRVEVVRDLVLVGAGEVVEAQRDRLCLVVAACTWAASVAVEDEVTFAAARPRPRLTEAGAGVDPSSSAAALVLFFLVSAGAGASFWAATEASSVVAVGSGFLRACLVLVLLEERLVLERVSLVSSSWFVSRSGHRRGMPLVAAGDQTAGDDSQFAIQSTVRVQSGERKYSQTDGEREPEIHPSIRLHINC